MSKKIYRYCINCGKQIITYPSTNKKYCTRECYFLDEERNKKKAEIGYKITNGRYVLIKVDSNHRSHSVSKMGYEYEHRYVMEKHLGRYLSSEEFVLHYNNDTMDNRIVNLYIDTQSNRVEHEEGTVKDFDGSLYIKVPKSHRSPSVNKDGFELYHRYLMERYLGRYLNKNEWVLFVNGDEKDVRIDNLKLVDKSEYMSAVLKEKAAENKEIYDSGLSPNHRKAIQKAAKRRKGEKRKNFNHPGTYSHWKYYRYGKEIMPKQEANREDVTLHTIINRCRYETMGYSRVEKNGKLTLQNAMGCKL